MRRAVNAARLFRSSHGNADRSVARCVTNSSEARPQNGDAAIRDTSILRWPPSVADLEHADEALRCLVEHEQQTAAQPPLSTLNEQPTKRRRRWQAASTAAHESVAQTATALANVLDPRQAARSLVDAHASNVCVINVSQTCDWAEHLVLGTCSSRGQASAAAGAILYHVKHKCAEVAHGIQPDVEGIRGQDDWLLVDCGSTIVHIFTADGRQFFDLEGMWSNTSNTERFQHRGPAVTLDTITI